MLKFWHVFGTVILGVASVAYAPLHLLIATNPIASTVLVSIWAILGNLLNPPATLSVSLKPVAPALAPAPAVAPSVLGIPKVNMVQP